MLAVRICANEPHLLCIIGPVTDSPEVTGSAFNVPSSSSTITPSSPSKNNSNAGAIAGGVVGGIVGVALMAGLVTWFTIRRRRRHAPSAEYFNSQGSDMGVVPYPVNIGKLKRYVSHFFFVCPRAGLIIALPRTLRTQARTRRRQLQRSTRRTQVISTAALRRTSNPTERNTMAYRRSESRESCPSHPCFRHVMYYLCMLNTRAVIAPFTHFSLSHSKGGGIIICTSLPSFSDTSFSWNSYAQPVGRDSVRKTGIVLTHLTVLIGLDMFLIPNST